MLFDRVKRDIEVVSFSGQASPKDDGIMGEDGRGVIHLRKLSAPVGPPDFSVSPSHEGISSTDQG